jgi:hypothetical protein
MATWFVFNGDADGLCAAHQLRLAGHDPQQVLTGVKRDIGLLARCAAAIGDQVWVADISLDSNRDALVRLLDAGVEVTWFDHHYAGGVPAHPALHAHIDTSAGTCSSLLVDQHLGGRHRAWAVVAAFGDNLPDTARALAALADLDGDDLDRVAELGVLLNYNAYGETIADLHVDPALLFARMAPHGDPRRFLEHGGFAAGLREAMRSDLDLARAAPALHADRACAALALPDAAWARRAQGVFANELARTHPERAHAILVGLHDGYMVSVRAPLSRPLGADALCRQFATGGGRAGAAGINLLPSRELSGFLTAFRNAFP